MHSRQSRLSVITAGFILFVLFHNCFAQSWEWVNPLPTINNLNSVVFVDNNHGWIVDECGGIWHTIDGGEHWDVQHLARTSELSGISFTDLNNGWAYGGMCINNSEAWGILLRTTNGGQDWSEVFYSDSFTVRSVYFLDADNGWMTGYQPGTTGVEDAVGVILHTIDGGLDWSEQASGTSYFLQSICFADSVHGWAIGIRPSMFMIDTVRSVLLKTNNGGQIWESQYSDTGIAWSSVQFIDVNNGWIRGNSIWRTINGGADWTDLHPDISCRFWTMNFADANDGWIVGAHGGNFARGVILHTDDGGDNWITQTEDVDNCLSAACFVNADLGWAVGYYGTVMRTVDGGNEWQQLSSESSNDVIHSVDFIDAIHGWALAAAWDATHRRMLLYTIDGGDSWVTYVMDSTYILRDVEFVDDHNGWIVGGNAFFNISGTCDSSWSRILYSWDGGENWVPQTSGSNWDLFDVTFIDINHGWAVGRAGEIEHTTDGGAAWTQQNSGTSQDLNDVEFATENHGWVAGNWGTLLTTHDGGNTWTQHGEVPGRYFNAVSFIDSNTVWAVGDGIVRHSIDGGDTWVTDSDTLPYSLEEVKMLDASNGWALAFVWQSNADLALETSDGGCTWKPSNLAVSERRPLRDMSFADGGHGWIVGNGMTVIRYTDPNWSSVDKPLSLHPALFTLSCYPNPFNASTTLRFTVPRESKVKLDIFDILGRSVKGVYEGTLQAGEHTLPWNCPECASGVYLMRAQVGEQTRVQKIMLLK